MAQDRTGEYRAIAQDCLDAANRSGDQPRRYRLLDMAQMWFRLAERAERNGKTNMVHATGSGQSG